MPAFRREGALKEDIRSFLLRRIEDAEAAGLIVSLVLYGSLALGKTHDASDCDIAVVASTRRPKSSWKNSFRTESRASSTRNSGSTSIRISRPSRSSERR